MSLPTLDRIFFGVTAGAAAGGALLPLGWAMLDGEALRLESVLLTGFALLFGLPLIFAPMWFAARAAGMRGWLGAALAGAAMFLACAWLIDWIAAGYIGARAAPAIEMLALLAGVGAATGFVTWRVSHWNVVQN